MRPSWSWGVGLLACAVNAVAVASLMTGGDALGAALFWAAVPVILGVYLLGAGRRTFAPRPDATFRIQRGL